MFVCECSISNLRNVLNIAASKTDNRLESLELVIDMKVALLGTQISIIRKVRFL